MFTECKLKKKIKTCIKGIMFWETTKNSQKSNHIVPAGKRKISSICHTTVRGWGLKVCGDEC